MTDERGEYTGRRLPEGAGGFRSDVEVLVDGKPLELEPSLRVWNHSPTGFEWGYGGSGPAQLALAILLDATGEPNLSARLHQEFKWDHVARWPQDKGWRISKADVLAWVRDHGGMEGVDAVA